MFIFFRERERFSLSTRRLDETKLIVSVHLWRC